LVCREKWYAVSVNTQILFGKPTEEDLNSVCDYQNRLVKASDRNITKKLGQDKYVNPLILIIALVIWYVTYKYQGMSIPIPLSFLQIFGLLVGIALPFLLNQSEAKYRK
jgi:hypothetical protein